MRTPDAQIDILVGMMRDAALAGLPAPSNAAVLERLGRHSLSTAARVLQVAEKRGLIRVERGAMNRVVEAADGSWRTAGEVKAVVVRTPGAERMLGVKARAEAPKQKPPPKPKAAKQTPPHFWGFKRQATPRDTHVKGSSTFRPSAPAVINAAELRCEPVARVPFNSCQFPEGYPAAGWGFCGGEIQTDSYCAAHHARAYAVGLLGRPHA